MPEITSLTDLVAIPPDTNVGISSAKQSTMLGLLGNPRSNYTSECQSIENPALKKLVAFRDLGAFKVRGLLPAVDSLERVVADIRVEQPQIFAALGTMGMLCEGAIVLNEESGAGDGIRTRDQELGKLLLYQLSYARPG